MLAAVLIGLVALTVSVKISVPLFLYLKDLNKDKTIS